jgi:hypothetical protein
MNQQVVVLRKVYFAPEPEARLEVPCSEVYELAARWRSQSGAHGQIERSMIKAPRIVLVDADWEQVVGFGMPTHLSLPAAQGAPERSFEVLTRSREASGEIFFEVRSP